MLRLLSILLLTAFWVQERIVAQPVDSSAVIPLPVTFSDARALGADPLGRLFVADAGVDAILQVDPSGFIVTSFGGPGVFDEPLDIDPTNGLVLLVADAGNGRIQHFSRAFAFLGAWPLAAEGADGVADLYRRRADEAPPTGRGRPVAVRAGMAGETLALDADARVVVRWDRSGRRMTTLGGREARAGVLIDPVALAVGADGMIYVADRGRGLVAVFDVFGSPSRPLAGGRAQDVRALEWHAERLWVVRPHEVLVLDAAGRIERILAPLLADELVDIAFLDGSVFILTARGLYRLGTP